MARRSINFSGNKQTLQRDKKILGVLLLMVAALLGGVYTSTHQLEQARSKQTELQNKLLDAQSIKPVPLERKLQTYWAESNTDWAGLFASLEEVKTPNITLLTIDPRLADQRVNVSGLAKDQEALNLYLTKLESSDALSHVELQRYRRTTQSPNGLEFFAVANWGHHE
jgi:Tfp pilus assembly protein PilN